MNEILIVGGGCFWCTEAIFRDLKGVLAVENGYSGGVVENPTYKDICGGDTGHAEVIRIEFDPEVITRKDLLKLHLVTHDPTTLNRQGGDVGTQYRSVIFVASEAERELATQVLAETQEVYDKPIVSTIEPLYAYYSAEEYHQDYFNKFESASMWDKMKMNSGYCQAVIAPKVAKFRAAHQDKLR